jgi:hypothetical protein
MFPGIKVDDRVGSEIYEANGLEQVAVFLDDFLNRFRSV